MPYRNPAVSTLASVLLSDLHAYLTDSRFATVDRIQLQRTIDKFTRLIAATMKGLDQLMVAGNINPFVRLQGSNDPSYGVRFPSNATTLPGTTERPLRVACVPTRMAPVTWIDTVAMGLVPMVKYSLDAAFLLGEGGDDRRPYLQHTKKWRFHLASTTVIPLFYPFVWLSDFADLPQDEIQQVPWKFGGEVNYGSKARWLTGGEDTVFKFFQNNPATHLVVYLILTADHKFHGRRYDSYGKVRDNIRAKLFGFNPIYHRFVLVFVDTPGLDVNHIEVDKDISHLLSIEVMGQSIIAEASEIEIKEELYGEGPERVSGIPHAAFDYIASCENTEVLNDITDTIKRKKESQRAKNMVRTLR